MLGTPCTSDSCRRSRNMLPLTMKPPIQKYVYDADESIAVSEVAAATLAESLYYQITFSTINSDLVISKPPPQTEPGGCGETSMNESTVKANM